MATEKGRTPLWTAETLTKDAAKISTSWINLSVGYGANIDFKLTNDVTGPTLPAEVQVEFANDYNGGSPTLPVDAGGTLQGGVDNYVAGPPEVGVYSWPVAVDIGVQSIRLTAGGNTDEDVVIDADISNVTKIN